MGIIWGLGWILQSIRINEGTRGDVAPGIQKSKMIEKSQFQGAFFL
jgi:hypothetical protein